MKALSLKARLDRAGLGRERLVRLAIPLAASVLVASVVTGREKPTLDLAPARDLAPKVLAAQAADADLDLALLRRAERTEERTVAATDPFARRSFGPEAAIPAAAPDAPAPAPQAPPLPFTYLGKVVEDGKLSVFLARGEDSYSVPAGRRHKLDPQYRVDKVTETQVVFTYLPMNAKQTLDIPAVN
jgi:hypothetical protein